MQFTLPILRQLIARKFVLLRIQILVIILIAFLQHLRRPHLLPLDLLLNDLFLDKLLLFQDLHFLLSVVVIDTIGPYEHLLRVLKVVLHDPRFGRSLFLVGERLLLLHLSFELGPLCGLDLVDRLPILLQLLQHLLIPAFVCD